MAYFGVGLTQLVVENRELIFLEVDKVENIFQWNVLKTLGH